ncbi:hypothetical protein [Thalassococcus lentus]|uniref:Uncharacterized protein n=1 Tax=Thalassococcus lentus TaxID=1210524 RepID=A0ABT4XPE4_9RHOB|nr:hypothetical protein [Thalassococcus lentus]MDA7423821.1 hypothetical protein [Thalassococcus lentus]
MAEYDPKFEDIETAAAAEAWLRFGAVLSRDDYAPPELFRLSPDDESAPIECAIWRIVLKYVPKWAAGGVRHALLDPEFHVDAEARFRMALALQLAEESVGKRERKIQARNTVLLFALIIHERLGYPIRPNVGDSEAKAILAKANCTIGGDTLQDIWKNRFGILEDFGMSKKLLDKVLPEKKAK